MTHFSWARGRRARSSHRSHTLDASMLSYLLRGCGSGQGRLVMAESGHVAEPVWTKRHLNTILVIAILAVFPAFFLLRGHPETIATLAAAGTVAAACFAAMAAVASMRAANESSLTATHAREALARSLRPALAVDVHFTASAQADGKAPALGRVMSASSNAVDVVVEWHLENGASRVGRTASLESWTPSLPPGSDITFGVDLGLLNSKAWWEELSMVRALYWDVQRLAQWESIWEAEELGDGGSKGWLRPVSMRIIN